MERMSKSVKKATKFLLHKVMLWPHTYPLAPGEKPATDQSKNCAKVQLGAAMSFYRSYQQVYR